MSDEAWFAGLDAGGTQTKGWLYRQGSGLVARGEGPPGNVMSLGVPRVVDAVVTCLQSAANKAGLSGIPPLKVVAACVAGARRFQEQQALAKELGTVLEGTSVRVYPDPAAGLISGTLGAPGVVVIAGTGSAAWALDAEGGWHRVGGWGYLLGDEGSGFWMGMAALQAVVRAADGLGPSTVMGPAIMQAWKIVDLDDVLPIVYASPVPRQRIAALAPLVLTHAKEGDDVAQGIVDAAVQALIALTKAALDAAGLCNDATVVPIGGLFDDNSLLQHFEKGLRAACRARLAKPHIEPAAGACILALQHAGVWNDSERETLLRTGRKPSRRQITTE